MIRSHRKLSLALALMTDSTLSSTVLICTVLRRSLWPEAIGTERKSGCRHEVQERSLVSERIERNLLIGVVNDEGYIMNDDFAATNRDTIEKSEKGL